MNPYRPFDPNVGDIVYNGLNSTVDVSRIKYIASNVGIITKVRGPNHGSLLNYEMEVTKPDGSTEIAQSQEWRCFRQLAAQTKDYSKEQERVIEELEMLIAPDIDI